MVIGYPSQLPRAGLIPAMANARGAENKITNSQFSIPNTQSRLSALNSLGVLFLESLAEIDSFSMNQIRT